MVFNDICPPALIYLIFSVTQIAIDTVQGMYNTAFAKVWVTLVFTVILNFLCSRGLGIVSWLLVFIPFMLMTLIIGILLYMFGLDPRTGRLLIDAPTKQFKRDERAWEKAEKRHEYYDHDDDYYYDNDKKYRHKDRCGKKYRYSSRLIDECDRMSPAKYEFHEKKCRRNKEKKYKYEKCIDKDSKYAYDDRDRKKKKHHHHHHYDDYYNHRHSGDHDHHARGEKSFKDYDKNLDKKIKREEKELKKLIGKRY